MYNKYFNTEEDFHEFNKSYGYDIRWVKRIALKDYHTEKLPEGIVFDRIPLIECCFIRDKKLYYYDAKNNTIFKVVESLDELDEIKDGENKNTRFKYGFYIKNGIEYVWLTKIRPKNNVIEIPDDIEGKPVYYASINSNEITENTELILGSNLLRSVFFPHFSKKISKLTILDNTITPEKDLLADVREFLRHSLYKGNLIINDKRILIENGFILSSDRTKLYFVYPMDEVTIPDSVEEIDKEAFYAVNKKAKIHCPSSLKVYFYDNLNNLLDRNFCDVPIDNLEIISGGIVKYIDNTIGENVKEITNEAANYLSNKDIILKSKNFIYQDDCVLSLDKKELVVCCIKPSVKTIVLPSYISSIYKKALDDNYTYFVQEDQKELFKELKEKEYKVKIIKALVKKTSKKPEFEIKNNKLKIINKVQADLVKIDISLFDSNKKKKFVLNGNCLGIKELIIPEEIDEIILDEDFYINLNPQLEIIHLPSCAKYRTLFDALATIKSVMLVIVDPLCRITFYNHKLPFIIGCVNEETMRRYVSDESWFNDYDRPNEITYINRFDRNNLIITEDAYFYKHAKSGCKLLKIKPVDSFVCPKKVGDIKVLSIAPYAFTNLKFKNYFIPDGIKYTELFYRGQFGEEIKYTGTPNKNYPPRFSGNLSDKDAIDSQEVKTATSIIDEINNEPKKVSNKKEKVKVELVEEIKTTEEPEGVFIEDNKIDKVVEDKNEETKIVVSTPSKENFVTKLTDFIIEKTKLKKYTGKDKNIKIPEGIKTIGVNSFSKNKNIENVIIPEGVNIIQKGAFKECAKLKNVSFPSTITKIDQEAFNGCSNLHFKEIPFSLNELLCDIHIDTNVKKLIIPDRLEIINGSIAGDYEELYISKSIKSINNRTFESRNLNRIEVDKDNKTYDSRDNCNAIIETGTNKLIFGIKETIIPNSIKIIGVGAYSFFTYFQKLVIPEGVEIIEDGVFCIDGLREIYIPKTVTNIIHEYGYQFMSDSLETIKVSKDNCTYYSDENSSALIEKANNKLLYLCYNKPIPKTVKIIGSESLNLDLDCLVVPEGVEELEKSAISNLNLNCSFNSFILPSSIKKIEEEALSCSKINTINIYAKKEKINKPNEYYDMADDLFYAKELIWVDFIDEKKDDSSNNLITLEKIKNKKAYASISYDCENFIYYISILSDGTFYFTSHKKKRYGSDSNEYFHYKKSRISYIEFNSDEDIEWYDLYESDKKSDNCFRLEIIRNEHSFYAVHNRFNEEEDFEDSSNKLKELIDFIINYYGKDNIKVIEVDKRINKAINNINTTNYNNTSNNSYNSNSNANAANMGYNSYKGGALPPRKKGCYIATCVYGSYDCKEVWRLRRYRDFYLDNHWFGRAFIKLYYFISPKLVKLFGNQKWFKNISKKLLDKKISKLIDKGYLDTPYNDKY